MPQSLTPAFGYDRERRYGTLDELVAGERARPDPAEAVAIMTPNDTHYPLAAAALDAGLDVVCDKPVTHDAAQARDLVMRTRRHGRLFAVAHGYSAYPMTRYARHLVVTGAIGELRCVQVEYVQSGLAPRIEDAPQNNRLRWVPDPRRSGLALVMSAIGCHAQHLASFAVNRAGIAAARSAAPIMSSAGSAIPARSAPVSPSDERNRRAWVGLAAVVIVLAVVDIQRFHRRTDPVSGREAALWSAVLVAVGLAFALPTAMVLGVKAAQEYLGGYLIEKALAIENVYAIAAVVAAFSVPAAAERRLLAWAITGAIGLRLAFLALGVAAADLRGLLPVFGSLLVVGGIAMALGRVPPLGARRNPLVSATQGPVRSTPDYEGAELVIQRRGRRVATPLQLMDCVLVNADNAAKLETFALSA